MKGNNYCGIRCDVLRFCTFTLYLDNLWNESVWIRSLIAPTWQLYSAFKVGRKN